MEIMRIPLNRGIYSGTGNFGVINKSIINKKRIEWYHCRELFHSCFDGMFSGIFKRRKGFLFVVKHRGNTIKFIRQFEEHLNLPEEERCLFRYTDDNNVIYIMPGSFWSEQRMRMSLFTILLRASLYFKDGTSWKDALYSTYYSKNTSEAIHRFLDGYTVYTGFLHGWVLQFNGSRRINDLLIHPGTWSWAVSTLKLYKFLALFYFDGTSCLVKMILDTPGAPLWLRSL